MTKIKLNILNGDNGEIQLLQNLLEDANLGLEKIDVVERGYQEGSLGLGEIINSLNILITSASAPLVELVKCIQVYISLSKSSVEIETADGTKIKVEGKGNPIELANSVQQLILNLKNDSNQSSHNQENDKNE